MPRSDTSDDPPTGVEEAVALGALASAAEAGGVAAGAGAAGLGAAELGLGAAAGLGLEGGAAGAAAGLGGTAAEAAALGTGVAEAGGLGALGTFMSQYGPWISLANSGLSGLSGLFTNQQRPNTPWGGGQLFPAGMPRPNRVNPADIAARTSGMASPEFLERLEGGV